MSKEKFCLQYTCKSGGFGEGRCRFVYLLLVLLMLAEHKESPQCGRAADTPLPTISGILGRPPPSSSRWCFWTSRHCVLAPLFLLWLHPRAFFKLFSSSKYPGSFLYAYMTIPGYVRRCISSNAISAQWFIGQNSHFTKCNSDDQCWLQLSSFIAYEVS